MNHGGDAAEQMVRMSLEGFEVIAKITGAGAKNLAVIIAAVLREEQKSAGKSRLTNMLKSGKELTVFSLPQRDLKKFTQEAKKYGVLYCVIKEKHGRDGDGTIDIITRAEDAPKINRVIERFKLAAVDKAQIVQEAEKSMAEKSPDYVDKIDKLIEEVTSVPASGKAEKSPQSEPSLKAEKKAPGISKKEKPSVREKLKSYKEKNDKAGGPVRVKSDKATEMKGMKGR